MARLWVTDDQSAVYEAVAGIQAQAAGDVDACLQALWGGMNTALVAGDRETALTFLTPAAQDKYGRVFDALLPSMPGIVASFSPLQRSAILPGIAEYAVNRTIQGHNKLFLIYFVQAS